jgi:hypothetical protein
MSSVETVADLSAAGLSKSYDRNNLLEDLERLKGLSFQAQLSNLHGTCANGDTRVKSCSRRSM